MDSPSNFIALPHNLAYSLSLIVPCCSLLQLYITAYKTNINMKGGFALEKEFCPQCGTEMVAKKELLKIRETHVGHYDAMSCPNCKYFYFTEKDYDSALRDARELGLIGPPLKPTLIVPEPLFSFPLTSTATGSTAKSTRLTMNTEVTNPSTRWIVMRQPAQ